MSKPSGLPPKYQYYNTPSTTNVTTSSFTGYTYPPSPSKEYVEIEKIKKTLFAIAQLLAAIYGTEAGCETRCGECVQCRISQALEELTKEQVEALAGEPGDENVVNIPTFPQPTKYPATPTPTTTTPYVPYYGGGSSGTYTTNVSSTSNVNHMISSTASTNIPKYCKMCSAYH